MAESKNENTTLVNFRIDSVVKDSAEAVLSGMGLNISAYVGMCLRKLAQERSVPFEVNADPGFWTTEARISKVMRTVEDGSMMAAFVEEDNIIDKLTDEMVKATRASEKSHYFPVYDTLIKKGTISDLYISLKRCADDDDNDNDNKTGRADFAAVCTTITEYIEERAIDFCGRFDIDLADSKGELLDHADAARAAVNAMSRILTDAAEVYEDFEEQLAMRFIKPKSDTVSLDDIAEYAAWIEEEDNRDREKERKRAIKRADKIDGLKEGE